MSKHISHSQHAEAEQDTTVLRKTNDMVHFHVSTVAQEAFAPFPFLTSTYKLNVIMSLVFSNISRCFLILPTAPLTVMCQKVT